MIIEIREQHVVVIADKKIKKVIIPKYLKKILNLSNKLVFDISIILSLIHSSKKLTFA